MDAKEILNLEAKGLDKKIHENYPYTYAQVFWALENEMAQKIEDVLARRIRLLFLDAKACEECTKELGEYLGAYFKWDEEKIKDEINEFILLARQYQI